MQNIPNCNMYIECSIYEVRIYSATPGEGDGECTVGDDYDYAEYAQFVDFCIYGNKYVCDVSGLYSEKYNYYGYYGDTRLDYNCTASEPISKSQIYQTGCNSAGSSKAVTQTCGKSGDVASGAVTYAVMVTSIISSLFYIISILYHVVIIIQCC